VTKFSGAVAALGLADHRSEYRVVSAGCTNQRFVAMPIACYFSVVHFVAAGCHRSRRTFNPKVVGSIPTRPITKNVEIAASSQTQHCPRTVRLSPRTSAHNLADRDLEATACPAATRIAGRRPATAPSRPVHAQHRDHGQRHHAALAAHVDINGSGGAALNPSRADRLNQVLLLITITLAALAAVNAIFITWATALDARHSSALARALGATPQQVSAGLSAAQVLPALAGAILGIPGGIALLNAVGDSTANPPVWQLLAVVPLTVLAIAALTAIPARISARRPVTEILQSELA